MGRMRLAMLSAVILILATLALWSAPAWAQMYRWTDEQGGVHYSQGLYSVPERFRSKAQPLAFPDRPAPSAGSSSAAAADVSGGGTRHPFTPGNPIMVTAKVNGGGSAQLMLDTGASVTVINPRVLAGMGIGSSQALRGSGRGATGTADALFVPAQRIA